MQDCKNTSIIVPYNNQPTFKTSSAPMIPFMLRNWKTGDETRVIVDFSFKLLKYAGQTECTFHWQICEDGFLIVKILSKKRKIMRRQITESNTLHTQYTT